MPRHLGDKHTESKAESRETLRLSREVTQMDQRQSLETKNTVILGHPRPMTVPSSIKQGPIDTGDGSDAAAADTRSRRVYWHLTVEVEGVRG